MLRLQRVKEIPLCTEEVVVRLAFKQAPECILARCLVEFRGGTTSVVTAITYGSSPIAMWGIMRSRVLRLGLFSNRHALVRSSTDCGDGDVTVTQRR